MSLTVIQRFYELAKENSEAPGLGMIFEGSYHQLPWWFVKSKVKHFGLGLLEDGAIPNQYFYSFPETHPNWIYAELAALTMGLQTLPLPKNISPETLGGLFGRYPPSFIFLNQDSYQSFKKIIDPQKQILRLIFNSPTSPTHIVGSFQQATFRNIFNNGIRTESKHHSRYRQIRQDLDEDKIMSPVQMDGSHQIFHKPLLYSQLNHLTSILSHSCQIRNFKKIFVEVSLPQTLDRLIGIYWPIFLGLYAIHYHPDHALAPQMVSTKPQFAFLKTTLLEKALENPESEEFKGRDAQSLSKNPFKKFLARRKIKKVFGSKIQKLLALEPLDPGLSYQLRLGKIKMLEFPEKEFPHLFK